ASQAASVAKIQAGIPDLAVKPDFTVSESLSTSEAITIDAFDAAGPANVAWIASVSVSDKMSSLTIFNGPLTDVPHLVSRCSVVPGGLHWKLDLRPRCYGAYELRKEDGSYPGAEEFGRKSFEYSGARKQFDTKFGTEEVQASLQSTIDSLEGDITKDYEIEGASGHDEDLLTRGPLYTSILMPNTPANVAAVVKAREQAADWWLGWATDGDHEHRPGAPVNTQYVYDSKFKINAYGALLGEYKAMYGAEDGQKLAVGESGPLDEAYVGGAEEDPEMINEEGGDEYVYATAEPFDAEADVAQRANEMAAANPDSIELQAEIEQSFLRYALSIILGRALPDARDGLKPVHRRILYAMHQLNLAPNQPHRKCARVVGEVLGKYHPHGDMAVYDALVRMAQDFSTYYRLIDGHGNFGSVDADPAAAMRYTECRLTRLATDSLMMDLSENTVDLIDNFDGIEQEPIVLPSRLPLLLLNGSSGIAVGMATNIPPHNLREILSACKALVGGRTDPTKEIDDGQLVRLVPGPDFPTGASILGTDGAKKLYTTGNGGVVMRAVTEMETVLRGKGQTSRTAIVVKELPYQVNKAALLEKIAALVNDKKLEGIADLRDESDRDGIRVVLELKRDAVPNIVLNNLYKKTQLQTSFSGNFLALFPSKDDEDALKPQRFTLRESLDCFLDFRFKTIRRKTANQLEKVEKRSHTVDGLLIALARVDEVIDLVRSAPDTASAKTALMDEEGNLKLSSEQADSVLKLQLGQLTRLNQGKLDGEKKDLMARQKALKHLLEEDEAVYEVMVEEFDEMDGRFGQDRKSVILYDDSELNEIDMVKNSRS
ncbi:MAG: hypothetical protein SGBAC_013574, partial [Bacillariaceae sp.]